MKIFISKKIIRFSFISKFFIMKRLFIFFSMIFLFTGVAMAQRTIQGSVKSSGQEPLIGANVVVKGTTTGTILI